MQVIERYRRTLTTFRRSDSAHSTGGARSALWSSAIAARG
jgi:hypothetical protein